MPTPLIKRGADAGVLTARQAKHLNHGRQIRDGMAHGQVTYAVMPPTMAVPMVTTSFVIATELCATPRLVITAVLDGKAPAALPLRPRPETRRP
ncbi:hypothetical protein ACF1FX_18895 [Streptomyces sp. NPDC014646]|uniref:hypothetical protein n=1 Tax=unclassified Streptomyces TaxID=2593676 RepID=UPI0036F81A31